MIIHFHDRYINLYGHTGIHKVNPITNSRLETMIEASYYHKYLCIGYEEMQNCDMSRDTTAYNHSRFTCDDRISVLRLDLLLSSECSHNQTENFYMKNRTLVLLLVCKNMVSS